MDLPSVFELDDEVDVWPGHAAIYLGYPSAQLLSSAARLGVIKAPDPSGGWCRPVRTPSGKLRYKAGLIKAILRSRGQTETS